jgi:hypothetical protein
VVGNVLRANISDVAPTVVRAIGAAISAAFLIGALTLVAMDQPATGSTKWSCEMPAKGGAPCLAPGSFDDQSNAGAVQRQEDCPSLGRAGRACAE